MDKEEIINSINKLDFLMGSNVSINGYNIQMLGINFMDYIRPWIGKKHYHDFYELHYVIDGVCNTFIGNIEHHVKPGHYYILQPGIMHSHRSQWHLGFCIRWRISKSNEYAIKDAEIKMSNYLQHLNAVCNQTAQDISGRFYTWLFEISRNSELYSTLACQLDLVHYLFCLPSMMALPDPDKTGLPGAETKNEIVDTCIRYINNKYLTNIKVADIADHVHMSYGYISRLFKKNVGHTISHEIIQCRLFKSQHYLMNTNDSIELIARQVGFSTVNYYSQCYKKYFQTTPSEFRKEHRRLDE